MEIACTDTTPTKNSQDNGITPPLLTQPYLPNSPPVYALGILASPTLFTRVDLSAAARLASEINLKIFCLTAADNALFGVYQDCVHQNPVRNLDGVIHMDGKFQAIWKNLFVCPPNTMTDYLSGLVKFLS